MKLHLPALPHLDPVPANDFCAYTAKVRRFPGILARTGIASVTYSGLPLPGAQTGEHAPLAEFQSVSTKAARSRWFGKSTWPSDRVFNAWEPDEKHWREFNAACIRAIKARIEPGDFVGLIAGRSQESIADAFRATNPIVEWGVGYEGILPYAFHAFESHAHEAYVAGWHKNATGAFFDAVIPNAFDLADLPILTTEGASDSYLLFLGRQTEGKGRQIVERLAAIGVPIVTAGQLDGGKPIAGTDYRGIVTGIEKAHLIADARAILVPSLYREPFGGVAVEAMLCGTPAITTPFGAFAETVIPGKTGLHARTLTEFAQATEAVRKIRRSTVAKTARALYTVDAVAPRYHQWLSLIEQLIGHDWSDL